MSDDRIWVSPYSYCQCNPIIRTDPTGSLDWIPPTDGSGNWIAQVGDSPGSLATQAGISQSEAEAAVKSANVARKKPRTSETMVYPNDVVNIPCRSGYSWSTGKVSENSSTSPTSNKSSGLAYTSIGIGNPLQTVNAVNYAAGIGISIAQGTLQNTRIGADFAYAISGNTKVVNGVTNGIKFTPYVGLGVTAVTGFYLSSQTDPLTNRPYQSWAETGTDIGANIGTIMIASRCGGWWGAAASTLYVANKTALKWYINTATEHPEYYEGIPRICR
jgi:hypothetical protein